MGRWIESALAIIRVRLIGLGKAVALVPGGKA